MQIWRDSCKFLFGKSFLLSTLTEHPGFSQKKLNLENSQNLYVNLEIKTPCFLKECHQGQIFVEFETFLRDKQQPLDSKQMYMGFRKKKNFSNFE